jgi:hypothetical protein
MFQASHYAILREQNENISGNGGVSLARVAFDCCAQAVLASSTG